MTDDRGTQSHAEVLGAYLKSLRAGAKLSLREVEERTGKEVSNAYLSQLENGKILKPSPNILHSLAAVYNAPYTKLMEYAGYISPTANRPEGVKHGNAATRSLENLTEDEERALLLFLGYYRTNKGKF